MVVNITIANVRSEFTYTDKVIWNVPEELPKWYKLQEKIFDTEKKKKAALKPFKRISNVLGIIGPNLKEVVSHLKLYQRIFAFIGALGRTLHNIEFYRTNRLHKKFFDEVILKRDSLDAIRKKEDKLTISVKKQNRQQGVLLLWIKELIVATGLLAVSLLFRGFLEGLRGIVGRILEPIKKWAKEKFKGFKEKISNFGKRNKFVRAFRGIVTKYIKPLGASFARGIRKVGSKILAPFRAFKLAVLNKFRDVELHFAAKLISKKFAAKYPRIARILPSQISKVRFAGLTIYAVRKGPFTGKYFTSQQLRSPKKAPSSVKKLSPKIQKVKGILRGVKGRITANVPKIGGALNAVGWALILADAEQAAFDQTIGKYVFEDKAKQYLSMEEDIGAAKGGYVEKGGLAFLHRGELVIPREAVQPKYIDINIGETKIRGEYDIHRLSSEIVNKIIMEAEW